MPTKTPLPRILSAAAVLTLALSMTARLLLRNLALFLYLAAEEQFAAIFSQLRTADIRMPILLLYALSSAVGIGPYLILYPQGGGFLEAVWCVAGSGGSNPLQSFFLRRSYL